MKNKLILKLALSPLATMPFFVISCSKNDEYPKITYPAPSKPSPNYPNYVYDELLSLEENLSNSYKFWYDSLSYSEWERNKLGENENAFCQSEMQALYLYCNQWGDFWNKPLHEQKQPTNTKRKFFGTSNFIENHEYKIRGQDYRFLISALSRSKTCFDFQVYHGVEFLEIEFWEQLKDFIFKDEDGKYNYSNTIGKEITSYGFLSTSTSKEFAYPFVGGKDWTDNNVLKPPLKEPALFIINIKKDTEGVAWVSEPFQIMGTQNKENQVLLNVNHSFKITNWEKDSEGVNIFTMDLIS